MNRSNTRSTTAAWPANSAIEVLPTLLQGIPGLAEISLVPYRPGKRLATCLPSEEPFIGLQQQSSRMNRLQGGANPWGTLLQDAAALCDPLALSRILTEATYHAPADAGDEVELLAVASLSSAELANAVAAAPAGWSMALSSRVRTIRRAHRHLALLDLALPCSPANDRVAISVAELLGRPFALLRTTHSYHYYGLSLLSDTEYLSHFLGRSALLAPLTDARWIAHQIIDGKSQLGIADPLSGGTAPTLLAHET